MGLEIRLDQGLLDLQAAPLIRAIRILVYQRVYTTKPSGLADVEATNVIGLVDLIGRGEVSLGVAGLRARGDLGKARILVVPLPIAKVEIQTEVALQRI